MRIKFDTLNFYTMEQLKVGDVVRLKSGGPKMTVYEIDKYKMISCKWFDKKEEIQCLDFTQDTLEKIEEVDGEVISALKDLI